jgi:DNA-binding NarL/FixJ family response regulator
MSPRVARRVFSSVHKFRPQEHASYQLTPQEHGLLKLLVKGLHKKTAASGLGISVNTVSFHLKHLYAKLQVHSKTEAVAKVLRENLI